MFDCDVLFPLGHLTEWMITMSRTMKVFFVFFLTIATSCVEDAEGDPGEESGAPFDGGSDGGSTGEADAGSDGGEDSGPSPVLSCLVHVRGSMADYDLHDGSSWELAYGEVQEGIDRARWLVKSGTCAAPEVWVASGVYSPAADPLGEVDPADPRTRTILLKPGVPLYGGFQGNETEREERDVAANEVILSGDIGVSGDSSDNVYHVVTGTSGATIDGFTITGGRADGSDENARGGGMYNASASPVVVDCVFAENVARDGGGMANITSSPVVTGCVFENNVTICEFDGDSNGAGGGMYNIDSSPIVSRCVFRGNHGSGGGGGMANTAVGWGGIGSSPVVSSCVFERNSTTILPYDYGTTFGGGIYNFVNSSPEVSNCVFARNTANMGGNVANITNCSPVFANCSFLGSESDSSCCMRNEGSSSNPVVRNSIFWSVDGDPSYVVFTGTPIVSYSDVQGGFPGVGNLDTDPLFIDPDPATGPVDLRLGCGSPCLDSGSTTALPADAADLDEDGDTTEQLPVDLGGNDRVSGASVDMGAYEYP